MHGTILPVVLCPTAGGAAPPQVVLAHGKVIKIVLCYAWHDITCCTLPHRRWCSPHGKVH